MEKIRIKNKSQLKIEVNDEGETIAIDLNDTMLPIKLMSMMKDITIKEQEFKEKADAIMQIPDEEIAEEYEGLKVTKNFIEYSKLCNDFCDTCRGYIDNMFGIGASQKIFKDVNNIDMFNDFFVQIQPILEKAGMTMVGAKKELVKKYLKDVNDEGVI